MGTKKEDYLHRPSSCMNKMFNNKKSKLRLLINYNKINEHPKKVRW